MMPRLTLFLCLLAIPVFCPATQVPQWLKPELTEESRAWRKEQPAVLLFSTSDWSFVSTTRMHFLRRGAILVHKAEAGSAKAVASLAYDGGLGKILGAKAWIVDPDERARSFGRAEFSDTANSDQRYWYNHRTLVFRPPELLKEGAILAWEFEYETEMGELDAIEWITPALPIWKAVLCVESPKDMTVSAHAYSPYITGPVRDQGGLSLRWEINRAFIHTGGRPRGFIGPINRVDVLFSESNETAGRLSTWKGFGKALSPVVTSHQDPTSEVREKALSLTKGLGSRWDRIRALASFVQAEVSYLSFTREADYLAGDRPQLPEDALKNRYGDCKDKATLLISLLRAIGEEGYIILLNSGNPRHVQRDWPANNFNHAIVAIPAGGDIPESWPAIEHPTLGKLVIVDATTPYGALGALPPSDQFGYALLLHGGEGDLVKLPVDTATSALIETMGTITLDPAGDAIVELRDSLKGFPGVLENLTRVGKKQDELDTRAESRLHHPFAVLDNLKTSDSWNPVTLQCNLDYRFHVLRCARKAGTDLLLVTIDATPELTPLPVWKTEEPGVAFLQQEQRIQELTLALPPGAKLSKMPADIHGSAGNSSLDFVCKQDGERVVVHTRYFQAAGLYEKADYEELRKLRQRYAQALKEPLILKTSVK